MRSPEETLSSVLLSTARAVGAQQAESICAAGGLNADRLAQALDEIERDTRKAWADHDLSQIEAGAFHMACMHAAVERLKVADSNVKGNS